MFNFNGRRKSTVGLRAALVMGTLFCLAVQASAGDAAGRDTPTGDKSYTINDLAWMAGRWVGEVDGAFSEDHWSEPRAGLMIGMFRLVSEDGKTRVILLETIQETDKGVEFRFRHFTSLLEPWEDAKEPLLLRLTELNDSRVVFVDPTPDQPKKNHPHRIAIHRLNADRYTSEVFVLREGKEVKVFSSSFNRTGPAKPRAGAKEQSQAKAGCATCIFRMKGVSGCNLAVKIDGKAYLVAGSKIDEHGDAHAGDGLCNSERDALVEGAIEGDRFVARRFELKPNTAP